MGYCVMERGSYCWSDVSGRPLGRCDISTKSWGMRGTSDAKIWRKSMEVARTATRVLEVATGWRCCSAVTVSDPGTELGLECSFPALCSFCSPSSGLTQRSLRPMESSTFLGWPPLGHFPALSCALVSVQYWSLQGNPWRMGILFCFSLIGMDGKSSFCQLTGARQLLPSLGVAGNLYQGHQGQ